MQVPWYRAQKSPNPHLETRCPGLVSILLPALQNLHLLECVLKSLLPGGEFCPAVLLMQQVQQRYGLTTRHLTRRVGIFLESPLYPEATL